MFERFSSNARRIVVDSIATAADAGAAKVGPEHLLLTLAGTEGIGSRVLAGYGVTAAELRAGTARRAGLTDAEVAALRSLGIDAEEVFRRIEEDFGPEAVTETPAPEPRRWRGLVGSPFEPAARKVLELSLRETIALGHRAIGSEHILLALLRAGVPGPMGTVLAQHGVTHDDARQRVLAARREAA